MAESRDETVEEQGNKQGGNNNNHQIDSTLARMVDYFERQESRMGQSDRTTSKVPDGIVLDRF